MVLLSREEIQTRIGQLQGWEFSGNVLTRQILFPSFKEAIAFANRVGDVAEAADHHPDITIQYRKVTLSLWTHSEGGVTRKDLDLAAQINLL